MGLVLVNIIPGPLLPLAHMYQTPPHPTTEAEAQGEGWQGTEEETTSPNPSAPYPSALSLVLEAYLGARVP